MQKMPMKGLQHGGIARRNKMINAGIMLFLKNGYEKTSTSQIAKEAGMSQASFFAAFSNKEALLLTLVEEMFESQFRRTESAVGKYKDPLLLYALETSIQMTIAETSEPLRELYVAAYTLPTTSEYIYKMTAKKLAAIFGEYMPEAEEKDFYELDIASAGITRGFMAKECNIYFTMEQKLRRYLSCCMKIYNVPEEKANAAIEAALSMDLRSFAEEAVAEAVAKGKKGFEEAMAE